MNDYAEMVSLALTFPTIIVGLGVLYHWGGEALRAFVTPGVDRTDVQWLIVGVAVGFMGSVLDNAYWGVAWTADYINHESRDFWFSNGVWPNIPFRQLAGVYAAYCHMRSFYVASKQGHTKLQSIVVLSLVLGIIYIGVCQWIRTAS